MNLTHDRAYKVQILILTLCQITPIQALKLSFFKIYLNALHNLVVTGIVQSVYRTS
jgi:hypothetical protein